MSIIIGGVLMPKYGKLRKADEPNETDRITLGGKLFTDFINLRRVWTLSWDALKEEEFQIVYQLFLQQYQTYRYHMMQFNKEDIYVPVKLEISPQDIQWNGAVYANFSVTIKEQNAFS